jgi:hypothetical protein
MSKKTSLHFDYSLEGFLEKKKEEKKNDEREEIID